MHKYLIQVWLIVLLTTTLPSCFSYLPKQPSKEAPVAEPPALKCLDKAEALCLGVPPQQGKPSNGSKLAVLAVDALTALGLCQVLHAELVQCFKDYRAAVEPKK